MAETSNPVGKIGVWTFQLQQQPAAEAQETARQLEELGYGAIWFGEAVGREAFTQAGLLLAGRMHDDRDRYRQHLRARSSDDERGSTDAGGGLSRPVSAGPGGQPYSARRTIARASL